MTLFRMREILLAASFLAIACSTTRAPSRKTAETPALKQIDPAALKLLVDTAARDLLIPGAMVLLRTPQGEFSAAYGTTLLGATIPPHAGTHFRIASNTKTMTAALILQLAQEKQLKLDDPVSKYVTGVPNGDRITIDELLGMRSGLYNYTDAPQVAASIDRHPAKAWSPAEVLALAFAHQPNFAPGAEFEYSNTNYALLSLIVEKVGRKPLAESMRERLFRPLQMQHTELPANAVNTIPEPYSHGYLYGSSSVAFVGSPAYSPKLKAAARAGTLLPKDYTEVNHSFASGAGGVISTANDLAVWMEALTTGRVLDAEHQRRWLDSLRPEDPNKPKGRQYGYGISKLAWASNTMYFHGGETAGYNSFMGCDLDNKVTLVAWTNLTVSLDGNPTANALMVKVLDHIYAVSPLSPAAVP